MSAARKPPPYLPVVGAGIVTALVAAIGGHRTWLALDPGSAARGELFTAAVDLDTAGSVPLVGALALVLLATWGVLLVTRGAVRRAVAALGVVVGLALLVTIGWSLRTLPTSFLEVLGDSGAPTHWTAWPWVTAISTVLSTLAVAAAWWSVPAWPHMGSQYDAPVPDAPVAGAGNGAARASGEVDPRDLWKALDEGHDPTA